MTNAQTIEDLSTRVQNVIIATTAGLLPVRGFVFGDWAAVPSRLGLPSGTPDTSVWTVAHVPSGKTLSYLATDLSSPFALGLAMHLEREVSAPTLPALVAQMYIIESLVAEAVGETV